MKTKTLITSLIAFLFALQMQAQYGRVNAMNDEISDNLDLRAVASLFGDSRNLQDFERRLNDPKIQISNLDLNYDNRVDYLRVIETVDRNTHLIVIQSVIDRDVYQDVATIEVERDRYNRVQVQFVGNEYIYGPNYIYEPVYYSQPLIYASFCVSNYRPYVSNWFWNYYPSYYYAWNPYPIYRYRSNIQVSINFHNTYNYVNYRRSSYAATLYRTRYSNGYERLYPHRNFTNRNAYATNRYELDHRRSSRTSTSRIESDNYRNGAPRVSSSDRNYTQRGYTQNRSSTSREVTPQRNESSKDYTPNRTNSSRDYSQNRSNSSREIAPQKSNNSRDYSENRNNSAREVAPQRNESSRDNSQSRYSSPRESAPQPSKSQIQSRSSENRSNSVRESRPQNSGNNGRGSSSNSMSNRRT
ncbi:hypothetical protein [Flavobacterium faecale]|uniref:hypothetical protein n=1 Tax=Flavobacterium faecale TaxID=1355330 RepID=UPI003AACBA11